MSKRRRRSRVNATGRTEGDGDFVILRWWLLRSPAFRSLSGNAVKVLLAIWDEHKGPGDRDGCNGRIVYSVRNGAEIGLSRSETARALSELIAKGFLIVERDSDFKHTKRLAREWRITAEPTAGGPPTKEFMRWSGDAPPPKRKVGKSATQRQRPAHDAPLPKQLIVPRAGLTVPQAGLSASVGGATVPRAGLSTLETAAPQSRGRDTSKSAMQGAERSLGRGATVPEGAALEISRVGGGGCPPRHVDNSRAADGGAGCAHDPDLDAVFRKAQPAFGREFAALRERRRVSVEEVAAAVGLQPDNWRRVEDGLAPSKTLKRAARRALAQMNGAHVL